MSGFLGKSKWMSRNIFRSSMIYRTGKYPNQWSDDFFDIRKEVSDQMRSLKRQIGHFRDRAEDSESKMSSFIHENELLKSDLEKQKMKEFVKMETDPIKQYVFMLSEFEQKSTRQIAKLVLKKYRKKFAHVTIGRWLNAMKAKFRDFNQEQFN